MALWARRRHSRGYRYRESLQLFVTVNAAGTRSCPQIDRPARRGAIANERFRSFR